MNSTLAAFDGSVAFWFWTTFSAVDFLNALMMGGLLLYAASRTPTLIRIAAAAPALWPRVSIVVAARNEERNVEAGIRSLLTLDYPDLQITVVNDRSTDRTGDILAALAREEPRLNVVDLTELPPGWLGKNHAMQSGADRSDGEWLLFTDADVVFDPSTLKRGIAAAIEEKIDHLAATPVVETPSLWLRAFIPAFAMCFMIYLKAWAVRDPKSPAFVGIGAFNLVRRAAYQAVGGHSQIPLRPDDDIKLGKILKQAGYSQALVNGHGLVSVEWYRTIWELVRGLEKNTFAGVDYRAHITIGACLAMVAVFIVPFVAPFFVAAPANGLFACAAAIYVALAIRSCLQNSQPAWLGLLFPVSMLVFMLIQLRTMWLNLRQGGIYWRETFYPLGELRKNIV